MVMFHSSVSLPEGTVQDLQSCLHLCLQKTELMKPWSTHLSAEKTCFFNLVETESAWHPLRIQLTKSSHQEQRACHGCHGCHGSRCQKRSASKMFMGIQRAKHPGNNQERIMFPEFSKKIISGELFFILHSLWFGVPSFVLLCCSHSHVCWLHIWPYLVMDKTCWSFQLIKKMQVKWDCHPNLILLEHRKGFATSTYRAHRAIACYHPNIVIHVTVIQSC